MKKITKKILPVLLGAAVLVPSVAAIADSVDTGRTAKSAIETKDGNYKKIDFKKVDLRGALKLELTEEQKASLENIKEMIKSQEITREEASEMIKELGIKFPEIAGKFQSKLTDEQKKALEDIKAKVEAGEITKEESREMIKELGIQHFEIKRNFKSNLTEEQKASIEKIREQFKSGDITKEELKTMIEDLGIEVQDRAGKFMNGNLKEKFQSNLTEEQKTALNEIKEMFKNGEITREEAGEKIKELGIQWINLNKSSKVELTEEQKANLSQLRDKVQDNDLLNVKLSNIIK